MTSAPPPWTLRLATTAYTPDHTVSVRMAPQWTVADDRFGVYRGDVAAWEFLLPRPPPGGRAEFKFVLDRRVWQDGPNLVVTPSPPGGDPLSYTAADPGLAGGGGAPDWAVVFDPSTALPDAEAGVVSRTFFAPALDAARVWDVVVVGSGVGGGVLADALSDRGVQTLVLETGSYVFPTHIANLPRKHRVGEFDKHVWYVPAVKGERHALLGREQGRAQGSRGSPPVEREVCLRPGGPFLASAYGFLATFAGSLAIVADETCPMMLFC